MVFLQKFYWKPCAQYAEGNNHAESNHAFKKIAKKKTVFQINRKYNTKIKPIKYRIQNISSE